MEFFIEFLGTLALFALPVLVIFYGLRRLSQSLRKDAERSSKDHQREGLVGLGNAGFVALVAFVGFSFGGTYLSLFWFGVISAPFYLISAIRSFKQAAQTPA